MAEHKGSDKNVKLVNVNKELEELVLRQIDSMKRMPQHDQRMVNIAFTGIQDAFMWLNRAVFQPARIALPGDDEAQGKFVEFDEQAAFDSLDKKAERPVEFAGIHGRFVYTDVKYTEFVPDAELKRRGL